jgi:hypothetical protein
LDPPGISSEDFSTKPPSTSKITDTTQESIHISQRNETKRDDSPLTNIPTISQWKLREDNRISGIIAGSTKHSPGPFTTSPILGSALSYSIVTTSSGSKYYLAEPATATLPSSKATPLKSNDSSNIAKSSSRPTPSARKTPIKVQVSHHHKAKNLQQLPDKCTSDEVQSQRKGARHFTFDGQYDDIKLRLANAKKMSGSTSIIRARVQLSSHSSRFGS